MVQHGELAQPEEEERDEPEEDACGALLGRPQEPRRALVSFGAMPPMRVEAVVDALKRRWPALEVVALCGANARLLDRLRARGDCVAEPMLPALQAR